VKRRVIIGACCVVFLVASFLAGRFSAPVDVREKVTTIRDESAITHAVAEARAQWQRETKTRVLIRTIYAEGKPVERVETRDTVTTASGSSGASGAATTATTSHATTQRETVTTSGRPGWALGVGGLWEPGRSGYRFMVEADRRIVGGLWLGARVAAAPSSNPAPIFGAALRLEW